MTLRIFHRSLKQRISNKGLQADGLIDNEAHPGIRHGRDRQNAGGKDMITPVESLKRIYTNDAMMANLADNKSCFKIDGLV